MVYITNGIELCVLFCITFVRFAHIVECGSVPVLLESTSLCDCTTLYISTLLKMTLGCFYFGPEVLAQGDATRLLAAHKQLFFT